MSGIFSKLNLFGKVEPVKTPEEQAKEWKKELKKQERGLERDITKIQTAEKNAMKECKKLAKSGQEKAAKLLAKEVVQTRRAVTRLHASKAHINSVCMNLQMNMSMLKVQGVMGKSTEIMSAMNQLVNIPELSATMQEMAKEMMRAGIIDEVMQESMAMAEPDGLELEADAEINKIYAELTAQVLTPGTTALTDKPTIATPTAAVKQANVEQEKEAADAGMNEEELKAIEARLKAL
jgi:charged multivesicular body protein 3